MASQPRASLRPQRYNPDSWIEKAVELTGLSPAEVEPFTGLHKEALQEFVNQQVTEISKIATDAYKRIAKILIKKSGSMTPAEIQAALAGEAEITLAHATTIARTESSRATFGLTSIQSAELGISEYDWETMRDAKVRHSHRKMQGKRCSFVKAPEVEPGKYYHAGCIYNCRCWAKPVFSQAVTAFSSTGRYKGKNRRA